MDISNIVSLINGVGFPIFVSVYLLISTNKLIAANTQMLENLSEEIKNLNKK